MDWPCSKCNNEARCTYLKKYPENGVLCPGVEKIINNNTARKEDLIIDVMHSDSQDSTMVYSRDYKDALADIQRATSKEHALRHGQIMDMPDNTIVEIRKKLVCAGLFFGISASKISRVLRLALQTVYRLQIKKPH